MLIQNTGLKMLILYSFYKTKKKTDKVLSSKASYYSKCIRRKCACNALTFLADQWDKEMLRASNLKVLKKKIKKVVAIKKATFKEITFQKRKQKELIIRRLVLVEKGLKYLDKLNILKIKKVKAIFDPVILLSVIFDFFNPFTFFLKCLDISNKMP